MGLWTKMKPGSILESYWKKKKKTDEDDGVMGKDK